MDYQIEIADVLTPTSPFIVQKAARGSISLRYLGGDDKTTPIVGSELSFSLEVNDGVDGKFDQYFTSDEQRYLVTKRLIETGEEIWKGFLLPESYSEPWENPLYYIDLAAVDGLGLLRGKRLPADFYQDEKTVIECLAAILQLTGLPFDILLAPAIQNHLQKNWKDIYVDTRHFINDDKKLSAYDILEQILTSLRCVIYQTDCKWYVEGINKRHLVSVEFYTYDIQGNYLGVFERSKNVKIVDWSPGLLITMVPPLKEVVVTHESVQLQIAEDIVQEKDITWRSSAGIPAALYPRHWVYPEGYQPIMRAPDYFLELPSPQEDYEGNPYEIRLKEKLYILRGWRVRVTIDFELISDAYTARIDEHIDSGTWRNINTYAILLNNTAVGYNLNDEEHPELTLDYNRDRQATGSYEFVASEDGVLDIALNPIPGFTAETDVSAVRVKSIKVEKLEQEIDHTYTRTIEEKSSWEKEINLPISDDVSGLSPSFYLEKVREYNEESSFKIEVPIQSAFSLNGNYYSVVTLQDAHLIEQYIDKVQYYDPGQSKWPYLEDIQVTYNLNGGEQMVVQTPFEVTGSFRVTVTFYVPAKIDRTEWLKWTDSIYGVERKRYAEVTADIESKLFSLPHLQLEGSAMAPLKFNDIIQFRYKGKDKFFVPTNLEWLPDINESTGTFIEGVYAGDSFGNTPPYVDCGPDLYLQDNENQAQVSEAVVSAPGGFVESLEWTKVAGPGEPAFSDPTALNPQITGLTGDEYAFQLVATNNQGLQGFDNMKVIRIRNFTLGIEKISESGEGAPFHAIRYEFSLDPALPAGEQLILHFDALVEVIGTRHGAYLLINKNGNVVFEIGHRGDVTTAGGLVADKIFEEKGSVAITPEDDIFIYMRTSYEEWHGESEVLFRFRVSSASFLSENRAVSNLPVLVNYTHKDPFH